MKASINSIETLGLLDGPGIRVVVFFNGCKLRCKYCHNPETWLMTEKNYTVEDLVKKIIRYKPYFKDNGGVTFSGGEPLIHSNFIIEVAKELKKENIHIAIDTAGVGLGDYDEILPYIDLVILDIKHVTEQGYYDITGIKLNEVEKFINAANKLNKPIWIRQVIIPNLTDTEEYIKELVQYLKKIKNIKKIEFLPFHRLGEEKYHKLNIPYPYEDKKDMDKKICEDLHNKLNELLKK